MNTPPRLVIEPQVIAYEEAYETPILIDIHEEGSHVAQFDHPTEPITYDVEFSRQPNNDFWEWDIIGEQPKR